MNIQLDRLAEKVGREQAERVCDEIEAIGGYGSGASRGIGGLDIFSALAESNDAIPAKDKARIAELAGVSRKDVEKMIAEGREAVERGEKVKGKVMPPDMAMDLNRK